MIVYIQKIKENFYEKNINKYEISNEMKYYNVDEDKLYYVVEVKNMYNDKNYDLVSYMEEI